MRISKLLMPAVTVAGALALAGCGGGSSTTTTATTERNTGGTLSGSGENGAFTDADCVSINGAGSAANSAGTGCSLSTSQATRSAFERAGGTPSALLKSEDNTIHYNTSNALPKEADWSVVNGENRGEKWTKVLNAGKVSLTIEGVTKETDALKVTGKATADVFSTVPSADDLDVPKDDVTTDNVVYMGIAGNLICNSEAGCDVREGKLVGDWYFYADNANAYWVKADDDSGDYESRDNQAWAEWGVWLDEESTSETGRIARLLAMGHVTGAENAELNLDAVETGTPAAFNKATYEGDAVGVSTLYETEKDKGDERVGSFTATAELTATFHDSTPTLEGKITKFRGTAVPAGDKWELTLLPTLISITPGTENGQTSQANVDGQRGGTRGGDALAIHGAHDGTTAGNGWSGQLYGENGERPDGVVGNFDGRFVEGQAVGVFHAD